MDDKRKDLLTTIAMLASVIIFIFSLISIIISPRITAELKSGSYSAGDVNFTVQPYDEKYNGFLTSEYKIKSAIVEITITNKSSSEVLFTEKVELEDGEWYQNSYESIYEYGRDNIDINILSYSVGYGFRYIFNYFILILSLASIVLLLSTEIDFNKKVKKFLR